MIENDADVPDFSDMTCTKMMILLKLRLRKTEPGTPMVFFVNRNQKDTVEVPFSRSGYDVEIRQADASRYRVCMTQHIFEPDP